MEGIAEEAFSLVTGDRNQAYGSAIENFTRLGRIWGAVLGIGDIPPHTVALMLVTHKIARESNKAKRDNRVDIIGYTILADQVITAVEGDEV